ncbi:MAG: sigma-70 family RNA polymerase sigma factor [Kiritimatiellae bacterium]|nr:sigma-70 family RNA polymerase sigma factor [Kiritimatiellia bacterium]
MAETHDFAKLFLPLEGELLAYILAMGVLPEDADDVLQDAATVMLKKLDTYTRGTNFRAWAYAIARIEVYHYRRKAARRPLPLADKTYETIDRLAASDADVPEVRLKALNACLAKLKAHAREIVTLRYTDELSGDEIAGRLDRSVDYVYMMLSRIRAQLRACITRFQAVERESA